MLKTVCPVHHVHRAWCAECVAAVGNFRTLKLRRLNRLSRENKARRMREKDEKAKRVYAALLATLHIRKPRLAWSRDPDGRPRCKRHDERTFKRADGTFCCRSCRAAAAIRYRLLHGAERARQRKHDARIGCYRW